MQVKARLNKFRRSAQKVRQSISIIKDLDVADATIQLEYSRKGDAEVLRKLLLSAVANAENNHGLNKNNLFVSNVVVEESKTMKRWRPRAYGRAAQILKRTCNVVIILDEKEEGKGVSEKVSKKKTGKENIPEKKEELEKEEEKRGGEKKGLQEKKDVRKKGVISAKNQGSVKGESGKKVYRRKSF